MTNWSILRLLSSEKFYSKGTDSRLSMFTFSHQNLSFCLMVVILPLTERKAVCFPCRLKLKLFNLRNISFILARHCNHFGSPNRQGRLNYFSSKNVNSFFRNSKTLTSTLPRLSQRIDAGNN